MKVRITPKPTTQTEDIADPLLIEPDPDNVEFYRVHKSLIDELIATKELLSENGHGEIKDPQTWCEERGYFELKSLLTKINAIQQASKGKFGS